MNLKHCETVRIAGSGAQLESQLHHFQDWNLRQDTEFSKSQGVGRIKENNVHRAKQPNDYDSTLAVFSNRRI